MSYQQYLEKTKRRTVSPLVQRILPLLPAAADILDLGCGAGVEVEALARLGHRVVAVDREHESIEMVRQRCRGLNVTVHQTSIEKFSISKDSFDAILAFLSLPFLQANDLLKVIHIIERGVRPEGFIVMRLFGPKDDWVKRGKVTPVQDGRTIFRRAGSFLEYGEHEKDDLTAAGDEFKHWHIIELIFQID